MMDQQDILIKIDDWSVYDLFYGRISDALRAVVEMTNQPLETENTPAQEVAWYAYGYNLALTRILDAIAKELE